MIDFLGYMAVVCLAYCPIVLAGAIVGLGPLAWGQRAEAPGRALFTIRWKLCPDNVAALRTRAFQVAPSEILRVDLPAPAEGVTGACERKRSAAYGRAEVCRFGDTWASGARCVRRWRGEELEGVVAAALAGCELSRGGAADRIGSQPRPIVHWLTQDERAGILCPSNLELAAAA